MAAPLRKYFQQILLLSSKECQFYGSGKICRKSIRCLSQSSVQQTTWQLHSTVYLQRYPVITTQMSEMDKRMKDYLDRIDLNDSLLSDHEIALENEKTVKSSDTFSALDMEDQWQKAYEAFEFAPVETEADRTNDTTSIDRKLDQKLFLIVKHKYENSEPSWGLPQVQIGEGESLRQAAERALRTQCGGELRATFMGNAPCGYSSYKLPHVYKECGVKQFYLKASYEEGAVTALDIVQEYKWVTLEEAKDYLTESMMKEIAKFDLGDKFCSLTMIPAEKTTGRKKLRGEDVVKRDRKALGMDSIKPQQIREWRGRLRSRLASQAPPFA